MKGLLILLALLALGAAPAATKPPVGIFPEQAIEVTIEYPGAVAQIVDEKARQPIQAEIVKQKPQAKLIFVSKEDSLEIYAEASPRFLAMKDDFGKRSQFEKSLPELARLIKIEDAAGMKIPLPSEVKQTFQLKINLDRDKLAKFGITLEDVIAAAKKESISTGSGPITNGSIKLTMPTEKSLQQELAAQLKGVLIETPGGSQVPLTNLADVTLIEVPDRIITRYPAEPKEAPKKPEGDSTAKPATQK